MSNKIKSILSLLLCFILLFSIIAPTVEAATPTTNEQELKQEIEKLQKEVTQYEKENKITGEVIDLTHATSEGNLAVDHYTVEKHGSDYTITLNNLEAKKLILPADDADASEEWVDVKYSGKTRETNITIILKGNNKITGYGIQGYAVKSVKFEGTGNLEIKAFSEPKVQQVRKLNGIPKDQLENAPVKAELNYYTVPGISVETGNNKSTNNFDDYSDSNSLVFAGTGNITIESPKYYGLICNGDIKFKSGNIKIDSYKSAISGYRILVGDESNTEFGLELNSSKEKAFYEKPTFIGNGYLIMASKSSGETYAEVKSKEEVEKSYSNYRYINVEFVNDSEAPEISGNLNSNEVYCTLPTVTVTDNTAIDNITVNGVKVTSGFTTNTAKRKVFTVPSSNQPQKTIIATDVLGNKSEVKITAYNSHQTEKRTEIVSKPTCTTNGSHIDSYYCTVCGTLISKITVTDKALGHKFGDWKVSENKKERSCTICGYKETEDLTVNISKAQITLSNTNYVYDGTQKQPTVTVKDGSKLLVNGKDYTVKYSNNVKAGTATVTISGKSNYVGTISKTFVIQKANNTITANNITKNYSSSTQSFTIEAKQTGNSKLTYKSDNNSVTVDGSGKVTIKAGFSGTAHITIMANETESYKQATKQITINVLENTNKSTTSSSSSSKTTSQATSSSTSTNKTTQSTNSSTSTNKTTQATNSTNTNKPSQTTSSSTSTNKPSQTTNKVTKTNNSITASNFTKSYSNNTQSFNIGAKQKGDAKLTYSSNNKNVTVNSSGKVTIAKGFVGKATITITANETSKYNKATKQITITVNKANNSITASNFTKSYSSKAQSFNIGAKQKGDAKLTYSSNNKKVTVNSSGKVTIAKGFIGKATITITAKETSKYNKATKQITITVNKINNSITASNFTKSYSSKAQSFNIGAKQKGDAKLTYSSNNKKVTVNSSGKVTIAKGFIGKATITITAKATTGYNKATKKITVTVNPPTIKISKLSNSGSKKMTINWNKSTVVTGYQIQYSTDKNFKKNVKTVNVSKNSTKSKSITKLTKNKTYYVRIRSYKTVSNVKYYSGWTVKSIKIKK